MTHLKGVKSYEQKDDIGTVFLLTSRTVEALGSTEKFLVFIDGGFKIYKMLLGSGTKPVLAYHSHYGLPDTFKMAIEALAGSYYFSVMKKLPEASQYEFEKGPEERRQIMTKLGKALKVSLDKSETDATKMLELDSARLNKEM